MSRVALVVDDSMLIRHSVCRFLEERGFIVESATNGSEALDILRTVIPDILITDLQMPKMDGAELIAKVKSYDKMAKIPIVVLAGRSNSQEVAEIGADFILYKDIEIDSQLAKAVKALLGNPAFPN
jgi:CheY-like chemotaxis protein